MLRFLVYPAQTFLTMHAEGLLPGLEILHQDTVQHKQLLSLEFQRSGPSWIAELPEPIRMPPIALLLQPLIAEAP
jgi:hypothetical protein